MSNPSPLIGAVLFAWLPDHLRPNNPGPKFRPVMVIDVDAANKRLLVAYGTSQNVDRCHRGEIVFREDEIEGLSKDTKFCLGNSQWIPISAEYLSKNQSSGGLAVLGHPPAKRSKDILLRLQEVANRYEN
jgi:hypothetical protein